MSAAGGGVPDILRHSPVRVVFAAGSVDKLGALARDEGASKVLVVTDPGIVAAGHAEHAAESLRRAQLDTIIFDGARENPTTEHVRTGVEFARASAVDFIVGVGGGSSLDCAKGINLILTNGGRMADYWGVDKPTEPLLPMIAVPTTAGTGSEAQSFALITDPITHQKMACGDRRLPAEGGLRPRVAILDPNLTASQPATVAAASGIDALAHAVETTATTERNDVSRAFSLQAWQLLEGAFEAAIRNPTDDDARAAMLLGAHLAGAAIETSMLGAAHACANPLTAHCGLIHGLAVGLMLPHIVRFNAARGANPYADLCPDAGRLAERLEQLLGAGGLARRLRDCNVPRNVLPELAAEAAKQWTARFNPRQVGEEELRAIYEGAH